MLAIVVLDEREVDQLRVEDQRVVLDVENRAVVLDRFCVVRDRLLLVAALLFNQSQLEQRLGMTLLEPLGSAERATGAAVVTLAGPDQAEVVPGRVEAGVFVDGALELALGVVRKS